MRDINTLGANGLVVTCFLSVEDALRAKTLQAGRIDIPVEETSLLDASESFLKTLAEYAHPRFDCPNPRVLNVKNLSWEAVIEAIQAIVDETRQAREKEAKEWSEFVAHVGKLSDSELINCSQYSNPTIRVIDLDGKSFYSENTKKALRELGRFESFNAYLELKCQEYENALREKQAQRERENQKTLEHDKLVALERKNKLREFLETHGDQDSMWLERFDDNLLPEKEIKDLLRDVLFSAFGNQPKFVKITPIEVQQALTSKDLDDLHDQENYDCCVEVEFEVFDQDEKGFPGLSAEAYTSFKSIQAIANGIKERLECVESVSVKPRVHVGGPVSFTDRWTYKRPSALVTVTAMGYTLSREYVL